MEEFANQWNQVEMRENNLPACRQTGYFDSFLFLKNVWNLSYESF